MQLDLFAATAAVFADRGCLDTASLYHAVGERAGLPADALAERAPVGRSGELHSLAKRSIRWHTQTLKHMGVVQRVPGERGVWELVEETRTGLHVPRVPVKLVAFSTKLGVAIWGDNRRVLADLREPVHLVLTSPPYPLKQPRAYGNPALGEYVDFLVGAIEPIVRTLARGGSIVLNLSNDIFVPGTPARSTYLERVVIAMEDRLGLHLMDRIPWVNLSKAPGPTAWASKKRIQLNTGYEPILWFSNAPNDCFADNRRVLEPHTAKHLAFVAAGGAKHAVACSDGAYRRRAGAFDHPTAGKIPKNVILRGAGCSDAIQSRRDAAMLGLPAHGAVMPTDVASFLINYLTEPDHLVLDPFGGKATTGLAAERLGRRWVVCDRVLDYLRVGAERFRAANGFEMDDRMDAWPRAA